MSKNINIIELSMKSGNEDVKTELSMMQRAYARLQQRNPKSTIMTKNNFREMSASPRLKERACFGKRK